MVLFSSKGFVFFVLFSVVGGIVVEIGCLWYCCSVVDSLSLSFCENREALVCSLDDEHGNTCMIISHFLVEFCAECLSCSGAIAMRTLGPSTGYTGCRRAGGEHVGMQVGRCGALGILFYSVQSRLVVTTGIKSFFLVLVVPTGTKD